MRHIVEAQQWSRADMELLFQEADEIRLRYLDPSRRNTLYDLLPRRLMYSVFYEPSTRTRFSFETAAVRLGMSVVTTENAKEFSSAVKGETLQDSIRVLCGYHPDVIVLRHDETGAAKIAASICEEFGVSLINAGDGTGQHPTQALLDIYTAYKEMGRIDGLTVVMGGDLRHGRTVRSLSYLLTKFKDVRMIFVSPRQLAIGKDILAHLDEHQVKHEQVQSLDGVIEQADLVYWTRTQKERHDKNKKGKKKKRLRLPNLRKYRIGPAEMLRFKETSRLLHPMPKVGEILPEVDQDPRLACFRQSENGLYIRMAVLIRLLKRRN